MRGACRGRSLPDARDGGGVGACVIVHERVAERLAGLVDGEHRARRAVDAKGRDARAIDLRERRFNRRAGRLPPRAGIARVRAEVGHRRLAGGERLARGVDDDRPRAGGAEVESEVEVSGH